MDVALDTSCTALTHAAPVDEAIRYKGSGRNGADGFVKVLNFDRGKVDAHYIAVDAILSKGDPVADLDQIVHVNLEVRQESFDTVLEDEDDDGGGSC